MDLAISSPLGSTRSQGEMWYEINGRIAGPSVVKPVFYRIVNGEKEASFTKLDISQYATHKSVLHIFC